MAVFPGKGFSEVAIGDTFSDAITITETHFAMGSGLAGDFNPLHVDASFARASRFGQRILHGPMTSAIMTGPVGMYFAGTAIAYLEHNTKFLSPVFHGDTLRSTWMITDKIEKPKAGGGILVMSGVCRKEDDTIVAEAIGKILVAFRYKA